MTTAKKLWRENVKLYYPWSCQDLKLFIFDDRHEQKSFHTTQAMNKQSPTWESTTNSETNQENRNQKHSYHSLRTYPTLLKSNSFKANAEQSELIHLLTASTLWHIKRTRRNYRKYHLLQTEFKGLSLDKTSDKTIPRRSLLKPHSHRTDHGVKTGTGEYCALI